MSYSHQREYAEAVAEAKKPETRARRIAGAVKMIRGKAAKAAVRLKPDPRGGQP